MARYYAHDCAICKGLQTHRLVGHNDQDQQVLECEGCGCLAHKQKAVVPKKKTTWPYYHEGCGVTFESESHEQKYAKANNLTKE